MSKFLILKFSGAKLFLGNRKPDDIIIELGSYKVRENGPIFKEPVTKYQIANVIAVLFGERPIPTIRKVLYPRIDRFLNMAEESYLKINCPTKYNKSKDKYEYITEKMRSKKAVYNSYNPNPIITWNVIKNYTGDEFNWFVWKVSSIIEINPLSLPFLEIRKLLIQKGVGNINVLNLSDGDLKNIKYAVLKSLLVPLDESGLLNDLCSKNLSALAAFIIKENTASDLIKKENSLLTVVGSVKNYATFNGEIAIPVNDNDLEIISKGSGTAKLLDGGFVYISAIKSSDNFSDYDYVKVSEISIEKN